MGWTAVRDAIVDAIVAASGLDSAHVIWGFQNASAPTQAYISLGLGGLIGVGLDYLRASTDLSRPAGQEVKLQIHGIRQVTLDLQCFTDSTNDSNDALALADRTQTRLILPEVRNLLSAVGLAPYDYGPVQYQPDIPFAGFRGRAICSIPCHVPAGAGDDIASFIGYILSVEGTITSTGGNPDPKVVDFDLP